MQDPVTVNEHPHAASRDWPRGRSRALIRLASFLEITIRHPLIAAVKLPFSQDPVGLSVDSAHRWAAHLTRTLGVETVLNTPLPKQGALIVANHRSYIDVCATLALMPLAFTAKAEVERWPVIGWAARIGGTVFVDRSSPESRDRTRGIIRDRLDRGLSMMVFPEGTTFEGPGLLEFRPGIFRLATEGSFPVVPAAIWYEERDDAWVGDDTFVGHFLRVFRKPVIRVHVAYGPPMTGTDPEELRARAWSWIRETLER